MRPGVGREIRTSCSIVKVIEVDVGSAACVLFSQGDERL